MFTINKIFELMNEHGYTQQALADYKEQAGHANISTTMQIYTHLDKLHKQRQINKLNDYLSGECLSDAGQEVG